MPDILAILPQQLVFGLVLGTVYGLIAIGYTMVYGVLFMINFAHGEIFMIGAYIGWGVLAGLIGTQVGGLHPLWVLPLMLAPAMIGCGTLGVVLERFAYRPLYLRGATRLGPLISAVGASIFLQNAVMLTQGARMKTYKTFVLFPRGWSFDVLGVRV
ncbi:MAG TPA: branched-chain amino acid ABC transporter permease, partial [Geminicoccaceae bacterium]